MAQCSPSPTCFLARYPYGPFLSITPPSYPALRPSASVPGALRASHLLAAWLLWHSAQADWGPRLPSPGRDLERWWKNV